MSHVKVKALKDFDHADLRLKDGKTAQMQVADARELAAIGFVEIVGKEVPDALDATTPAAKK